MASPPIHRGESVTDAERYLLGLCDRTFLSLWSYPGVYRDQGSSGQGKEVADLLVVFGNDIIVFSDKDCAFPDSGDPVLDWRRWFKRAVWKSAQQAWGAERWIRKHPDRLFLDKACTEPFPIDLPPLDKVRFHQIVVAHNAVEPCRRYYGGGSGSFMINSEVTNDDHYAEPGPAVGPFVVGDLDPRKGFVHVLEDTSLNVLLSTLDTVADFTAYLRKKERLLRSGLLVTAAGEEELLARYLANLDADGEHGFDVSDGYTGFGIDEGHWLDFCRSPQRRAQLEADRVSYTWDGLIETFNQHIIGGRYYYATDPSPRARERIVRFLAAEPRFRRRFLGRAIRDLVLQYPDDGQDWKAARVILPRLSNEPHYVFLVFGRPSYCESYEEYREARGKLLEGYCLAAKHVFPDAEDIVGIATSPLHETDHSEDSLWLEAREWTAEQAADAAYFHKELGLLTEVTQHRTSEKEYPEPRRLLKNPRNKPCPCGSGRKYKHCHGRT